MAHDVFISYSHKDKSVTDAVCSIMEKNRIRCWIAPRDITPGVPFAEAIIDGIKEAKVFVLVYSQNSNQSAQVIKEVDRAVHHGIAIIPLRIEDVPMSKQMEYYVSDVHWLDAITPPLEKHINKLCKVVQMLLTMDEVDDNDIKEALRTDSVKQTEPGKTDRSIRLRKLLIPAIVATFILVFFLMKFSGHQKKTRWARDVALPEIERLIAENDAWRNLVAPYRLAERAEAILGNDPVLTKLFSQISLNIDIITDPSGAKVYMKEYVDTTGNWIYLGISPLNQIRVPVGIFRWKLEKEGYDTVMAAASTWKIGVIDEKIGTTVIPNPLIRILDLAETIPQGMVRVPSIEIPTVGTLGDFFIGRYEVTNREYKAFLDAGGYRNRQYWNHDFVKNGQKLTWEEAMKEFIDQSGQPGPSTWMGGDFLPGQGNYPVSGVSWYEAAAFAEYSGMSLPTIYHWHMAMGGFTPMIKVPQLGGFAILAPFSNFGGRGPMEVGSMDGITAYGAYDMPGNIREWCWNESIAGRIIRGGSWEDNTYEFENLRQAPAMDRSERNGIRLAFYPQPGNIPEAAFATYMLPVVNNAYEQKPVSDDIFKVYKEMFAYDPMRLNEQVEYRQESPGGWFREKVSFDAAYGGERILAYLFLPVNVSPPYQTVIYFPGSASTIMRSSQELEKYYEFPMFLSYLVRNGRAVLYPIYKGTFERGDPALTPIHEGADSYAFTGYLIQLVKDFRRCIDYLETRPDIDSGKLAYYGMSWGGLMGAYIPAIEERIDVSILIAGSLGSMIARPEANEINYITRVRVPTLMMNGIYDNGIDIRIKPMFDLLGTPTEDKRLILYETDHIPPRAEYIKETLEWLDRYLGPVR
jgi:dienelactone hydrolase